jgi:hypothetical protein
MKLVRVRLVGLAFLALSTQLGVLGSALSALCCATDAHAAPVSLECTMPHEPGATCPMHHAPAPADRHSHEADNTLPGAPLLACGCSPTAGVQALVGTAGIITPAYTIGSALTALGSAALPEATPTHLTPQVDSPPPRG